jgi:hypothetical protein
MGFIVGALITILLFRDKSKPLLGNWEKVYLKSFL